MTTEESPRFSFLAGALCLDFCNTVDWRIEAEATDRIQSYAHLVEWGRQAGVLSAEQALRLSAEGERRPAEATEMLASARTFREALFDLFLARVRSQAPAEANIVLLNGNLAATLPHARLLPGEDAYVWDWAEDEGALDRMLWPVTRSAADLLTGPQLVNVGLCNDRHCGWLFVDTTRNRRRRWCSMEDCGNRNKARRFFQRQKAQQQS